VKRELVEDLVFGDHGPRRFTQDSPVLPDVWIEYARDPEQTVDLLLEPVREAEPSALARRLIERLSAERKRSSAHRRSGTKKTGGASSGGRVSYNMSQVVAELPFDELVRVALPLTGWWRDHVTARKGNERSLLDTQAGQRRLAARLAERRLDASNDDLRWLVRLVGSIQKPLSDDAPAPLPPLDEPRAREIVAAFAALLRGLPDDDGPPLLWSVSLNRPIQLSVWRSVESTKADAARRLFGLHCEGIRWAVVDSGIDATHVAFRRRDAEGRAEPKPFVAGDPRGNRTRVAATWDFTRLRTFLSVDVDAAGVVTAPAPPDLADAEAVKAFQEGLKSGRMLDWQRLDSFLRVPHEPGASADGFAAYRPPVDEHGTHVAGILAGDWRASDTPKSPEGPGLSGMCPDLELYDLRALDDAGRGREFEILSALQFIRWLNAQRDEPVIHGVNVSLSLLHDVANYACGRTPVCEECERLVATGVVVVVAAGNEGYSQFTTPRGPKEGYRSISITDPGNAASVITVGATHRFKPHTFGVSYFSSRGPTGDGRAKPDLVAPGEKIKAPIPGGRAKSLDGTSMAAPHVSGAAALLLARHRELIGRPTEVKAALCGAATDLGRERFFQGAGMLDVLRAIQRV
jgi:serine protease AprX